MLLWSMNAEDQNKNLGIFKAPRQLYAVVFYIPALSRLFITSEKKYII